MLWNRFEGIQSMIFGDWCTKWRRTVRTDALHQKAKYWFEFRWLGMESLIDFYVVDVLDIDFGFNQKAKGLCAWDWNRFG